MGSTKEPGAEEFGRRLKARREQLGLSRRDVVAASGLSYPYVSQLETGYRLPSHKSIAMLAAALELPPSDLSAAIPLPASLSAPPDAGRAMGEWRLNPAYAGPPASSTRSRPRTAGATAREVAELVSSLPRRDRLAALGQAQQLVMEQLVKEEVAETSEQ